MNDISGLLDEIGLPQYKQAFQENDIEISIIGDVTGDDLKEIGIASLGHRRKILALFKTYATADAPTSDMPDTKEPPQQSDDGRAERREVTTVFADLTGYTTLSREMETEDLHEVLTTFFERFNEIVIRMGGTVDKHIGDCVMAVFGAPISKGNDAERALRATLEMHRAMQDMSRYFGRDLSVHIGAAAGKVIFSTKGYGQRKDQDFTLTGETVNLASRLADQAKAGETQIDDLLFKGLSHTIECNVAVDIQVKGFDEPISAHRFIDFVKHAPQSALIGRDAELEVFCKALDRCAASGAGETIYLVGDAGMGKTRLLQDVATQGKGRGFDYCSTLVFDFGLGDSQSPVNALIGNLCGLGEHAHQSAIEKVADMLVENNTLGPTSALLLMLMLGAKLSPKQAAILDAMDETSRAVAQKELIRRVIQYFSSMRPKLLTIEDVHWADPSILPIVHILQEEALKNPVVLVITSRPEGMIADTEIASIESASSIRVVRLNALTVDDAMKLANTKVRPSQDIVQQCVDRAQGNPLFLEQLLKHNHNSNDHIPGSIQSLIQARFDRLDPVDRRILQSAAILGQRFSLASVTAIAGVDIYDERPLIDAALIRQIDEGYLFAHAMIREAILSGILRNDLQELHRSAAAWFATRNIVLYAEHLAGAKDQGAARAFLEAALDADQNYKKDAALGLTEKGLNAEPNAETRGALLRNKGELLRDLGKGEASIAAFVDASECASSPVETCLAQIGMVSAMRILDRIDEAFLLLDKAQKIAESENLLPELSEIHYFRGSLHFPRGNLDQCLDDHSKSLDFAKRADLPERQALALSGLGDAYYARGRMFTAHKVIEECLWLCDEHGFGAVESANRFMLATVKIYMNETKDALAHAQRSAALATEIGLNRPEIVSRLTVAWVLTAMARYQEALAEIATGLELARRLGAKRFEPFLEEVLARIEFAQGNRIKAASIAEQAKIKLHDVGAETFIGPWIMSTVALTTLDATRRHDVLAEGEALLAKGCVGHNYFRFYCNAMDACLNASEWDEAVRYADIMAEYTAKEPTPWSDFYIARTRALVDRARGAKNDSVIVELQRQAEESDLRDALPTLLTID